MPMLVTEQQPLAANLASQEASAALLETQSQIMDLLASQKINAERQQSSASTSSLRFFALTLFFKFFPTA